MYCMYHGCLHAVSIIYVIRIRMHPFVGKYIERKREEILVLISPQEIPRHDEVFKNEINTPTYISINLITCSLSPSQINFVNWVTYIYVLEIIDWDKKEG